MYALPSPWFVSARTYIKIKRGLTPSTQNYYRNKRLNPIDMHIGHIHTCLRYLVAQGKLELLPGVGVDHVGVEDFKFVEISMHTVALDDEFDFHHIIDKIGHVGVDLALLAWIPLVAGNLKTIETVGCADIYGIAIGQKVMLSNATLVIKPKVEINLGLRTTESQHVK